MLTPVGGLLNLMEQGGHHAKSHPPYKAEFRLPNGQRRQEAGGALTRSWPPATTIINWLAQAARDAGKPLPGKEDLTTAEREELVELARLHRENRQFKMERDILAKAKAWLARKSDVGSPNSSNS